MAKLSCAIRFRILVRVEVVKYFKEKISWYEDAFSNK